MENISYHGTNEESAKAIVGPPPSLSINRGKGELGRGFYTSPSISQAATWAQGRFKEKGVVIKFDIEEQRFVQLKGRLIKTQQTVVSDWELLKSKNEDASYISGYDYTIAPFATVDIFHQIKFESKKSEDELNACKKTILKCES